MQSVSKILLLSLSVALACAASAQSQLPEGGKRVDAFAIDTTTPVSEVKEIALKAIKGSKPRFSVDDYIRILDELKDDSRYVVVNGRDFAKTIVPDKIVVYVRHDEDGDPWTALRMAQEEQKRGISGTYYFRPTAAYYGKQEPHRVVRYANMDEVYRQIADTGADIGVHTDLLEMKIRMDIDPLVFQQEELKYWRDNGFDVVGSVANGSSFLFNLKLNNMWMFSEFGKTGEIAYKGKRYTYGTQSVKDFGFQYEGYRNSQNKHISDITLRQSADQFIEAFRAFKPGDRVSFLTHPMHWRADNQANADGQTNK